MRDIHDSLTKVFRSVFGDDDLVLRPELNARDVAEWDSLTHVRLLVTVERAFGVKFTVTEVGELKNVGDLTALIETKLSAQN